MADTEHDEATGEMSDGLQVELFHPDSDRSPGDTNRELLGGRFDVHPVVFPGALLLIVLFVAITLFLGQEQATAVFDGTKSFIESTFGWFYLLAVNVFLITIVYFAVSKYGSIRIGGVEAEKEFSTFSWMAMLFSAGMGIGLMFFSVTEPVVYFNSPPAFFGAEANTAAAGTAAMAQTFFHWGLSPWAIYGLVGLGLAFFSFNRGLPLTFRSIFWPLLGDRIYGWPGHVIDLVSVFATLFGLCTSLGLGVAQVNSGISYVGGDMLGVISLPINTSIQILLIAGITLIAVASVAAGLDGGVKRLSTVNLYLMLLLLGFLFIVGPTLFVVGTMAEGLGAYLGNFLSLSLFTGTLGAAGAGNSLASTVSGWTVFYWGWWIAWSPFVGMFIARISKGRTVREFVMGVLILPTLFSVVWLSTFGGSALATALQGSGGGAIMSAYSSMEYATFETLGMFIMLEQYPLGAISGLLATLLVITFFVTSSDSGSLVIDHLTSGGKHDVPRAQRVFWATTEGIVAAVLLWGGGLTGLQAAAISTGLPFAVILLVMCYTVYLGLDNEYQILESEAFREQIDQISDQEDVAVDRTGGDVVTGVSDGGDTTSDD